MRPKEYDILFVGVDYEVSHEDGCIVYSGFVVIGSGDVIKRFKSSFFALDFCKAFLFAKRKGKKVICDDTIKCFISDNKAVVE